MFEKYKNVTKNSITKCLDEGIISCSANCDTEKSCSRMLGFGQGGDIIILGQAPSYLRRVGDTNKYAMAPSEIVNSPAYLLWKALVEVDFPISDTYFTNLLKCSTQKNRALLEPEVTTCFNNWLSQEITIASPKLIVCLGNDASEYMINMNIFPGVETKKIYHHSYIARDKSKFEEWKESWVQIKIGLW